MDRIIEIITDNLQPPNAGSDLYENRAVMAKHTQHNYVPVTIWIIAYNRVEKTKRCVESVLKYTEGIDYELILFDNGSTDGTRDYFCSVPYEKKRIYHVTKNVGGVYPSMEVGLKDFGQYLVVLANDLIVTKNWLSNMLLCAKSDPRIGMVNPVCNNVSNLQGVEFSYRTYDEMQNKAAQFNQSDPEKWEDRLRLVTLGTMYRKEAILALGWPPFDFGFFHDFTDDATTFAVRRAGYRTVLATDTWICHDHDYSHGENKDPKQFQASLEIGRKNFRDKYFGVDAWDDVNNYYRPYLGHFPAPHSKGSARVLGVDVRCGSPILDIKNWLRRFSVFNTELSAFTQDPKYWIDLKTICGGPVVCDREEFLLDSFPRDSFDYVVADHPLNRYHEPQKFLSDLFSLCRRDGYVICRLKNTATFQEYANMLGRREIYDPEISYGIPLELAQETLQKYGTIECRLNITFDINADTRQAVAELLPEDLDSEAREVLLDRLVCKDFLFVVRKT
ncbi:MAG: glycosyltransferase family 2 protein [Deltaproteobacteria bacterium]|nr:glycosyltransferase family 2 protein [Deltaproteobacteria bacterium]